MTRFRSLVRQHTRLAALLIALAVAVKALVPAGYMIDTRTDYLTVIICSGAEAHSTVSIPIERESAPGDQHQGKSGTESPCLFAGLSLAALGGADLPLLAVAIAFVLALGFAPVSLPPLRQARHLLPLSHGPPSLI